MEVYRTSSLPLQFAPDAVPAPNPVRQASDGTTAKTRKLIAAIQGQIDSSPEITERLERQQVFRKNGWCLVPWNKDLYPAQIIGINGRNAIVKIFKDFLSISDWPGAIVPIKKMETFQYEKCDSQEELIASLERKKVLRSAEIKDAFRAVDRAWFCSEMPYMDAAITIGEGMCISAPHMHVLCLELLSDLFARATNVLDVGTGSGYMAAVLAELCPNANITGIDCFESLIENARKTCSANLQPSLIQRMDFVVGNGEEGYSEKAPYDIILAGFMCTELPMALVEQLKPGGRLVVPVGDKVSSYDSRLLGGKLMVVNKNADGALEIRETFGCSFISSQIKDAERDSSRGG